MPKQSYNYIEDTNGGRAKKQYPYIFCELRSGVIKIPARLCGGGLDLLCADLPSIVLIENANATVVSGWGIVLGRISHEPGNKTLVVQRFAALKRNLDVAHLFHHAEI